jgi:hypothetical protein
MKTQLKDFSFTFAGSGHYKVIYTSPATFSSWRNMISDMTLIDATKNSDNPKRKDLNWLKKAVKRGEKI